MLKYITLTVSLFLMYGLNAQETDSIPSFISRLHIEAAIGAGWGTGNLGRKFDRETLSIEGAVGYKLLKNEYLYLQVRTAWNRLRRFQTEYILQIDNINYEVTHSAASSLLDLQIGVKYEAPQIYYIIPFMQFSIGGRNAYLYSEIRDDFNDEVIDSYVVDNDWSYLYTISAGLQVPISEAFHLHLTGKYSGAGAMRVNLPEDNIQTSRNPVNNFMEQLTAVELFHLNFGMTIYFLN